MLKQTLRVVGKMIGTQQIRNSQASAAAEEFQHASFGELRLSSLGFAQHIESFQLDQLDPSQRTITFGIDTAACKTVVAANHPVTRGYLIHKDSPLGRAYRTAGRDKVYDEGKRILCTLDGTGKPMVIESRKVNCRRPLMAVTEMTDCGRRVCFGSKRQGFDDDVGTTGESQQNNEQSDSGEQRKEESSCNSQRLRSSH